MKYDVAIIIYNNNNNNNGADLAFKGSVGHVGWSEVRVRDKSRADADHNTTGFTKSAPTMTWTALHSF